MKIQLLTETTNAESFLADDDFCVQEKLDGSRCLIVSDAHGVRAMSRQLRALKVTAAILRAAAALPVDSVVDGELVGERFIAFDIQRLAGRDLCALPMIERFAMLDAMPFERVRYAVGADAKRALLDAVRAENGEGVVFKKLDAPYRDGRDVNAQKFKLWQRESFVVRSVDIAKGTVGLLDRGRECGRCPFPFNSRWPRVGDLVAVRFARRTRDGKLLHPVWRGAVRDHQAFS